MSEREVQSEDQELATFTEEALRRNQPGSYEELICQHLIRAVGAPPLDKIRLICEAAYMTDLEKTGINKDTLDILYKVSTSLLNTFVGTNDPERYPGVIAWCFNFNEASFTKYLSGWMNHSKVYLNPDKVGQRPSHIKDWQWIDHITTCGALHLASFESIRAAFIDYAVPASMHIFGVLAKQINPEVYSELIGKMKS